MAKMLDNGDSSKDVNKWHQMRFGKKSANRYFTFLIEGKKPNEKEAVKQVCEIFRNISTVLIKSSWGMTGFKKFAHFEEASDP